MSNVVVNVHRLTIAPELVPGSRWQPYDPEVDRPSTVTEGAHLAQYYSDAWLAACKAGELLQLQAEQEIQRLEQKTLELEQQLAQTDEERERVTGLLADAKKQAWEAKDKVTMAGYKKVTAGAVSGFVFFGFIGFLVGFLSGRPTA